MADVGPMSDPSDSHENEPPSEPGQDAGENPDNPMMTTEDELSDEQVAEDETTPQEDSIFLDDAAQPSIQWQDLEYVHPVCDALLCGICKAPFSGPVTTVPCGHTFCFSCLDEYLSEKRAQREAPCPMCRSRLRFTSSAQASLVAQVSNPCNRIVAELLDGYIVRCPNNSGACGWEGPRCSVEKHVRDDCEHTLVPCVEIACPQRTARGSASLRGGCLHRKEQCCYCHLLIDISQEYEHLNNVCPAYKAPCEACGNRVERGQLAAHTVACWETVASCDFADDGCSFAAARGQLKRHVQSCIYGTVRRMGERLALSESATETMRRQNHSMMQELQNTRDGLDKVKRKNRKLRQELQDTRADLVQLRRDHDTVAKVKIPELISSFSDFERRIRDLSMETYRQSSLQSNLMTVEMAQWKQEVVDMQGHIGGLATQMRFLFEYQNRQRQSAAAGLAGTSASATGDERDSRSRASSNEPRPSL